MEKGSGHTQVFLVTDLLTGEDLALKIMVKKSKLKSEYKHDMVNMEIGSMMDIVSKS